jgi:RNA polymerase sigma factor (sigma-70 family)
MRDDIIVGMSDTDLELLGRYQRQRVEAAFAELVRRNIDLVYSAALRQVRSPQLAEEVTQSAFMDLARQADQLEPGTVVSAWLYQVTRRTAIDVVRREARRQARERVATELSVMDATPTEWMQIEPLLDEAMEDLEVEERNAVLLRYFENKSLREVADALGISEEAARKRVSRAIDRLREIFFKRGVTAGAASVAAVLSAHAVQAAPAALSAGIISVTKAGTMAFGATAAGAAAAGTTEAVTKTIAMTTLQKAIISVTIIAAAGTGLYQTRQVAHLREQNQMLLQQKMPLEAQIASLERERAEASRRLAAAAQEAARLSSGPNMSEILRLRGEVGALRQQLIASQMKNTAGGGNMLQLMQDPGMKEYMQRAMQEKFRSMFEPFFEEQNLPPEKVDQMLAMLVNSAGTSLAVLSTPAGSPEQAEAKKAASLADQQWNSQLKALLGEAGFKRFKEFDKELPARATLGLLKNQLGEHQLNEQQKVLLLDVIKAEPQELTQGLIGAPDEAFFKGPAETERFLQQVAESNQRVLQQAGTFLEPDQWIALNTVLTNSVEARKVQSAAFAPKPSM